MVSNQQGFSLGSAFGRIVITTNAQEAVQEVQSALRSGVRGMSSQLQALGAQVADLGGAITTLTAPLAGLGAAGIASLVSYDDLMTQISARTGLVGNELEAVGQYAKDMGAATVFSTEQTLDAFLDLLTSGQSVEEAFETLPGVLDLAAAGSLDLGYAADTVTDIMAQFQLDVDQSGTVVDALARAASSSSADVGMLAQGFGNVGPVAAQFGLSVDETAATLATFSENGIKGAEAGTQLRSMLLNMTRNTDDVTGAWGELGVNLYDAEGNMRNLDTIIDELGGALDGLPMEEQNRLLTTIGGSYGIVGLSALVASGGIDQMQTSMASQASASEVAAQMMTSLRNTFNSLVGSGQTLLITVLEPMLDDMKAFIGTQDSGLIGIVNKMTAWAKANPETAATITKVLAVVTALGPILFIVGQFISAAGVAVGALGAAFGLLLSPVGLVIAALVAFGVAYTTNFGGLRDMINNQMLPAIQNLWTLAQPYLQQFQDWFTVTAIPAVIAIVQNVLIPILRGIGTVIGAMWALVQPLLLAFADWFVTSGLPAAQVVLQQFMTGIRMLGITLLGAYALMRPVLAALYDWFVTSGGPFIVAFWNNLKTVVTETVGFIIDQVNRLIDAIEKIPSVDDLQNRAGAGIGGLAGIGGGLASGQFSFGDVARGVRAEFRDAGGPGMPGELYAIGQAAGVEAFVSPRMKGDFMANVDKVMEAAAGIAGGGDGGGATFNGGITINVPPTAQTPDETAAAVQRGLEDALVRRGFK